MKLMIALIRNGRTESGEQERYLGLRDEALTERAREELAARRDEYPQASLIYSGLAVRCRETAALLYPGVPAVLLKELAPFDYGELEGRTAAELEGDAIFRRWAEAEVTEPCPGGEDPYRFQVRCGRAFRMVADEMASKGIAQAALIAHGGAIDAMMQRYCIPRTAYRSWQPDWGCGYFVLYDTVRAELQLLYPIGAEQQNNP